jgi:hypothetical protein
MINLRGAAIAWKRKVIQQVVGGASELSGEHSSDSSFTLVLKRTAAESAKSEANSKGGKKSDNFHHLHDMTSCVA